jgi:hypothetical protein
LLTSLGDAELLRLVREWRPSTTLHPIAMQAWHIYQDAGRSLPDVSLQKIRAILDGYGGELLPLSAALEGLVRFSIHLSDDVGDTASADKVVVLMREYAPLFEPFFARVDQALNNAGMTPPATLNGASASVSANANARVTKDTTSGRPAAEPFR